MRHYDEVTAEISDRLTDLALDWTRLGVTVATDCGCDQHRAGIESLRRVYAADLGEWIVRALADGYQLEEISELTDLDLDQITRFPGVPEELDAYPV